MRRLASVAVALWFVAVAFGACVTSVDAACRMTPREDYNPTGWEGCTVYGTGLASRYDGPGVARNDCLWPWMHCTPIRITALATGRTIVVRPVMFCDCYHGTQNERLVDLNRAAVAALGLDWSAGVFPVQVEPVRGHHTPALPDTAVRHG